MSKAIVPYKKKANKRPYKSKASTSLIKYEVNKIINRKIQTKKVTHALAFLAFNSGITSASEFYPLVPILSPGVGDNQRIGDSIEPVKIVVKGYITFLANSIVSAEELISRMFIFQDKSVKSHNNVGQMNLKLIDSGAAPTIFNGSIYDTIYPHNTEHFSWYMDKRRSHMKPYGYTNSVSTTQITSMNKTLVQFFSFTFTKKHLPAKLYYDSADLLAYPTNFNPVIALGYAYAQNNTPDVAETKLGMTYTSTLYYKDA